MFENLLSLLGHAKTYQTPLPEADAQHAIGALLVRAAKADHKILFEEIQMIDKVLAQRFDLNPIEAAKMRASCEKLESEMPDTVEMTQIIKDAISSFEKEATLTALWAVVYADGVIHVEEDELLQQIEAVLGVSPARAKELKAAARG